MSLADKFYLEYSKLREKLKFQLIPTQKTYDEMQTFLVDEGRLEKIEDSSKKTYANWKAR